MIPIRDDNPVRATPYVTISIIALNAMVFLYQLTLGGRGSEVFIFKYGAIPYEISHFANLSQYPNAPFPPMFTLVTSLFIHGGFLHILGNMLYLWIFGDNIEYIMGSARFLIFYLLAGVLASLAHIIMTPNSTIPLVGASGAIAGVLGAYILKFPKARVLVVIFLFIFIQTIYIPAVFVLGFWFLLQLLSGFSTLGTPEAGGVAWFAHIGGFLVGMALVNKFQKRRVSVWW